ncbi:ABC transporter permease [Clostridium sp. WILCCON 0269]|uniref:ABC transporter permease n=1 Tax=Candidatus Clostridium eludens TaxID=3381663 RepID=A0ABW8SGE0_9CLOT
MKLKRLLTVTKKEFIHIKRDKPSLVIALVMPIMMLLLFGFAANTDVNDVNLMVYDGSKTVESRQLVNAFINSYYFKLYGSADSPNEVEKYIDMGKVKVGIVIPPDYARTLDRNETAKVQVLVDGSDPTIARTAMSYSMLIGNNYSAKMQEVEVKKSGRNMSSSIGTSIKPLVLYNPTLESSKFNVPGVMGLILQNITVILTSFAMVREREKGTMEQLIMTPISSFELVVGKLIPYTIIGFLNMITVLILGNLLFGIVVKGSVALFITLGTLFLICSLAIGMLISTVAKTQLQAMQASLALLLPSVLLSGFMFPREAMPKIIYLISCALPLTYFLQILRAIIVKGVGVSYIIGPILSLSISIVIIVGLTMVKFSKTLD